MTAPLIATTTPSPTGSSSTSTTVSEIATTTQAALPYLEGLAALLPGFGSDIAMALKLVGLVEPYVLQAIQALMTRSGSDLLQATIDVIEHLNPNAPNNAALGGTTAKPGTSP
jgi:hypothetical protein